ncbi:MAG: alpha-galactosidase [Thermomicrobiales bacterium]
MPESSTSPATGSAFARQDSPDRWSIGTERVRIDLAAPGGHDLHIAGIASGTGHRDWTLAPTPLLALTSGDADAFPGLRVSGTAASIEDDVARMAITLTAADGSTVVVRLEAIGGQAIVHTQLEITPANETTLTGIAPLRIGAPLDTLTTLSTVSGVQRQGGWQPEEGPYRSFRLEERPLAEPQRIYSGERSTWSEMPWAALTGDGPSGILLAIEYGAQWDLVSAPEGTASTIGYGPVGLMPAIAAGETWCAPPAWIGAFDGDLDGAAAITTDYLRAAVVPQGDDTFPWVQYNTWFSFACELDAATLLREAELAASLGVEVFYVDAGWWTGNPTRWDQFSSGLGTWVENRDKFPNGLAAFAEGIRQRGMHFGIWFEPERIDLRHQAIGGWHPDWIARNGDRWVRCDWPADTDTAWLCFGLQATQDWAFDRIAAVIAETGARWLKWDSNYWGICDSPDHDHGTGDGEAAQVAGVYAVMDRLRDRFPDLIIENCAGGGTRMDYAIARHTHTAWLNDASAPAQRSRFHNAGAGFVYPPEMLNAWVMEWPFEALKEQDQAEDFLRTVVRSRMLGALGLSCRLQTWTANTSRVVAEEIARYKEHVRPLVRHGHMLHLLDRPQPEMTSPRTPTPDTWEAYGLALTDGSRAVAIAFRNAAPANALTVRMKALQPDATYRIVIEDAEPIERDGASLMTEGITVACAPTASVFVRIARTDV